MHRCELVLLPLQSIHPLHSILPWTDNPAIVWRNSVVWLASNGLRGRCTARASRGRVLRLRSETRVRDSLCLSMETEEAAEQHGGRGGSQ
jgi:hypothetical protein